MAIGACATAGGIQALRNFADIGEFTSVVYARPDYIHTLATSTPPSAHVTVDYELRGCPIDRRQLLDTLAALLVGRKTATCPPRRCAPNANAPGSPASRWPRAFRASGRSPTPAAVRCAPAPPRVLRLLRTDGHPNMGAMIPLLHLDGMSGDDVDRVFSTFNVTQFADERSAE